MVLVDVAVLLAQGQHLLQALHPVGGHAACVEQLGLVFPPVVHVALLGAMLRGLAVIDLNEVHHLLPMGGPVLVLCHGLNIVLSFRLRCKDTFFSPIVRSADNKKGVLR